MEFTTKTIFIKEKKEIIDWLDQYGVKNYELIINDEYGYVVNVHGDLYLKDYWLSSVPVKFNHVNGLFNCSGNSLKSLDWAPVAVGKDYICSHNLLRNLKGVPKHIHGKFDCGHNQLTSLEFCPSLVENSFSAITNDIQDLIFFPKVIVGKIYLWNNSALEQYKMQYEDNFEKIYQFHCEQAANYYKNVYTSKLKDINLSDTNNSKHKI